MSRKIVNDNVAVIGACGFIGSHCVEHLIEDRKCNVLAIDNLVAGKKEFLHKDAQFEYHDITGSEQHLLNLFKKYEIKYVLNFAAFPYVPTSFIRPLHVFDINANGALKVINAAQDAGCEGILQISSAELYGNGPGPNDHRSYLTEEGEYTGKITEYAPVEPHSSYGASKAAIDAMVQVRWKEAKTPCIALRLFNNIGERDITHRYVVPEIISQLSTQQRGNNTAKVSLGNNSFRDFQYAGDSVRMAVELLEKGGWGEVYNLGSEEGIKMYDLAKLIGELMGFSEVEIVPDPSRVRPFEIWHLQSDNSKIYSVIERRPTISLREALQRTITDFCSNGRKWAWQ